MRRASSANSNGSLRKGYGSRVNSFAPAERNSQSASSPLSFIGTPSIVVSWSAPRQKYKDNRSSAASLWIFAVINFSSVRSLVAGSLRRSTFKRGWRVVAQVHFQTQLLQAQALHKIGGMLLFLRFHVLRGIARHGCFGTVVESHAMTRDQQASVQIRFHHPVNSPLVEQNVLIRGDAHECVGRKRFGIHTRRHFPFLPAVIVLGRRQAKRCEWLRAGKRIISPFPRKKAGKDGVVRLPDHQHRIVSLLDNH